MLNFISNVFKYSLAVLCVIVLSHIIEIKGVSISQHVQNGLNFFSRHSPGAQADRITASFKESVQSAHKRFDAIDKISDEQPLTTDQRQLNHVIQTSQKK